MHPTTVTDPFDDPPVINNYNNYLYISINM